MSLEFVDTNVLVYAYDASDARHGKALELVAGLGAARRGALSVQVLQEFFVTVTRKIAKPLSVDQAVGSLETLARWSVHSPLAHDVVKAARLAQGSQLSFWDAMVVQSAASLGCGVLWTEDLNDGQSVSGVRVRNPFNV
jgi:predicted nucleic acid-binding protein